MLCAMCQQQGMGLQHSCGVGSSTHWELRVYCVSDAEAFTLHFVSVCDHL